jgi:pyruvate carboxylase
VIRPLGTNLSLLRKILADESFRAGQYDDTFFGKLWER